MNGNKRKLMVFHQYLAPYRIDFFNALARIGEMEAFLNMKILRTTTTTGGKWKPAARSAPNT